MIESLKAQLAQERSAYATLHARYLRLNDEAGNLRHNEKHSREEIMRLKRLRWVNGKVERIKW